MIARQRHDLIVEAVKRAGTVTVPELAESFNISQSTIRRDLEKLDAAGRLVKVHGGAVSLEDEHVRRDLTLPERAELHTAEKLSIVRYAASLVGPDDFVYIDAGTTCRALVDVLQERSATYVTDSLGTALALCDRGFSTIVLGGQVKNATEAVIGPEAVDALSRFHFSLGFWGTNGIDLAQGFTTVERQEAQIKALSMAQTQASGRYVVCDATKFDRIAPISFAPIDFAHVLTNDLPAAYRDLDSMIVVAS